MQSLISTTSTTSGAEETSGFLCCVEFLPDNPVPKMSKSWSSLQQNLWHVIFFHALLSIVSKENPRNGDRSIAGDRRFSFVAEVGVLLQCAEDLVPMRSVAA